MRTHAWSNLFAAAVLAAVPLAAHAEDRELVIVEQPGAPARGQRGEAPEGLTFRLDGFLRTEQTEKGAWLGLGASSPEAVVRKQLKLPAGTGLVVDTVVPDSPAGKAGLQKYDVLTKLDDQLLVNVQQLSVLVRAHKPGDDVKLTLVREGQLTTVTAKLVEKDLEPLEEAGAPPHADGFPPHPEGREFRMRPMPPGGMPPGHMRPGPWGGFGFGRPTTRPDAAGRPGRPQTRPSAQ